MTPRAVVGVTRRALPDDEAVLLAADGAVALVLNPLAAIVWDLCDGTRAGAGIAAIIAERFPDCDPARVDADVDAVLARLAREGFLEDAPCGSAASTP